MWTFHCNKPVDSTIGRYPEYPKWINWSPGTSSRLANHTTTCWARLRCSQARCWAASNIWNFPRWLEELGAQTMNGWTLQILQVPDGANQRPSAGLAGRLPSPFSWDPEAETSSANISNESPLTTSKSNAIDDWEMTKDTEIQPPTKSKQHPDCWLLTGQKQQLPSQGRNHTGRMIVDHCFLPSKISHLAREKG